MRTYLAKKKARIVRRQQIPNQPYSSPPRKEGRTLKELSSEPDYSNEASMAAFRKLGPLKYIKIDQSIQKDDSLTTRGPIELNNGEVYVG